MNFNKKLLSLLLLTCGIVLAQNTPREADHLVSEGVNLFHQKHYSASIALLEDAYNKSNSNLTQERAKFYTALAYLKINTFQSETTMLNFLKEFPNSVYKSQANFALASHYFQLKKFALARNKFSKMAENALLDEDLATYYFQYGYSLFVFKQHKKAKTLLAKIKRDSENYSRAQFYLGYIAYQENQFLKAKELFNTPFNEPSLKAKSAYYLADISFREKNYAEAISKANRYLPRATKKESEILYKILGGSSFQLKKYKDVIKYLNSYQELGGKLDAVDKYELGFSKYSLAEYHGAVQIFNTIIGEDNTTAQNAYYHLAASYLALDKKQEALNAFRATYEMPYSKEIAMAAQFHYAQLSYDIGNPYEGAVQALSHFIANYPKTSEAETLKKLLVRAYVESNDYESALQLIDAQPSLATSQIKQQVNFSKGISEFELGSVDTAAHYFETAYKLMSTTRLGARSLFWLAESQYNLGSYQLALQSLLKIESNPSKTSIPEYNLIPYQRGSIFMKMKRYSEAIPFFEDFLETKTDSEEVYRDALLRLGDAYYVSNHYSEAIETYKKSIQFSDYAAYRIAMSYGFLQNNPQKIKQLIQWIDSYSSSQMIDRVVFELANTYAQEQNTEDALETYQKVVDEFPKSALVSQALLRKGLLYYNNGAHNNALSLFRQLADDFPKTEEAIQGVKTAKRIYIDLGDLDSYTQWVKNLGYVNESQETLDKASFESAQQLLLKGATDKVVGALEYYIKTFPKGQHQLESRFELAKIYQQQQKNKEALSLYDWIVQEPSKYREESLVRSCQILIEENSIDTAIVKLIQLEQLANRLENEQYAQANLMRSYYSLNNFDSAVIYADKLLSKSDLPDSLKLDAQLVLARSEWNKNNFEASFRAYEFVGKNATGSIAAEAAYYLALAKNKRGDFVESNKDIQALAKNFPAYKIWAAQGLVLMADNFTALKDTFQAHYILSSVRDNFSQFPKIVQEANQRLQTMTVSNTQKEKSIVKNDSIKQ